MNDQTKTREELVKELQELRKEHDALRKLYEKKPIGVRFDEDMVIKLLNAVNITSDAIFLTNTEGIITYVNSGFTALFGYTADEVIGKVTPRIIKSDLLEKEVYESFWKTLLNKTEVKGEILNKRKNGELVLVEGTASPILDEQNTIIGFIGIQRDITGRKRVEEALQESEEKYRNLVEYSPDAIFINQENKVKLVNRACLRLFGARSDEELLGKSPLELIHPDFHDTIRKRIQFIQDIGEPVPAIEEKIVRLDGSIVDVEVVAAPFHLSGVNAIHVILRDITERKQAEEKLEESETQLRQLFENMSSGVAIYEVKDDGNDFIFKDFNHTAEKIENITREKVIGNSVLKIFPGVREFGLYEVFQRVWKTGKPEEHPISFYHDKRISSWRENYVYKLPNGKIVAIYNDISERKRVEEELIIAKEHAEQSDKLKSAFLANMSHEIRTPMNGILGFAGLLKEPNLTGEEQQKYISIIEKSGARMLNIITDIVSISKIESGQMEVSISETNVFEIIEEIYELFKPEIERKGLRFLVNNPLPTEEANIRTDHEKIFVILTNLVKNAIKFTNKGSIEFGYEKKGKYLEFFVKDTGEGIPGQQKEIIFERFRQVNESATRNYEGAGLGLSISKAYVEMLGGRIWVVSEVGKGSIFYFTIPYIAMPDENKVIRDVVSAEDETGQIKNLKLLIVEDDEISEMFITTVAKKFSYKILYAKTGVESVDICRKNPDIDLVLMDIRMSEMDGYEATRQIRQFNKEVIIIAQTAYGLPGDRKRAIEAGCNDYISKPINKDELLTQIQEYFSNE